MSAMIEVGVSKDALIEARKVILDILNADRSDQVTLAALDALTRISSVNNTHIQNCNLTMK